jgi:hypothetical protein
LESLSDEEKSLVPTQTVLQIYEVHGRSFHQELMKNVGTSKKAKAHPKAAQASLFEKKG